LQFHGCPLVFFYTEFAIQPPHAMGIEKDQYDEYENGTLLSEPETELESAEPYAVQRLDEDDPEQE
jgi:hypothetical protein